MHRDVPTSIFFHSVRFVRLGGFLENNLRGGPTGLRTPQIDKVDQVAILVNPALIMTVVFADKLPAAWAFIVDFHFGVAPSGFAPHGALGSKLVSHDPAGDHATILIVVGDFPMARVAGKRVAHRHCPHFFPGDLEIRVVIPQRGGIGAAVVRSPASMILFQ